MKIQEAIGIMMKYICSISREEVSTMTTVSWKTKILGRVKQYRILMITSTLVAMLKGMTLMNMSQEGE